MKIAPAFVGLWLLISMSSCLVGTKRTDVSKEPPFSEVIGKQFVIQKDLYIYHYTDGWGLETGDRVDLGNTGAGMPETVDHANIGLKTKNLTIKGVLNKGDVIEVTKAIYEETFNNDTYTYLAVARVGDAVALGEFNVFSILDLKENPPEAIHWATPPVFKANLALPVASDGEWWKP